MNQSEFKFPDEQQTEAEAPGIEIEVVDDTPAEDRGREPLPKEIVKELEDDDLEEYSEKVKKRLSQMKKVWHDERREKEAARREADEALRLAQVRDQELRKLREYAGTREKTYTDDMTKAVTAEVATAKSKLKQAYESGDPNEIADAQEALTDAKIRLKELEYRKPSLQPAESSVEIEPQSSTPAPVTDPKAEAWRRNNTWFGVDEEMTSLALGLHSKMVKSGVDPRSDDYYRQLDSTLKKRFPEYFNSDDVAAEPRAKEPRKPATVVAPATRSTAPTKIRLTQTQLGLAKKLGLTPEQYAQELIKLEARNG
jgi:DNA polymerase III gamma/tau subunit